MSVFDTGLVALPSMSGESDVAAGKARENARDAADARMEAALEFDSSAPTPGAPIKTGRDYVSVPSASRGGERSTALASEKAEEAAGARLDAALSSLDRGPATPERPRSEAGVSIPGRALYHDENKPNIVTGAWKRIDQRLSGFQALNEFEARTGLPKALIATVFATILSFSMITGIFVRPLTALFTLAWPTIAILDLANRNELQKEWKKWATYFAIAAWVNVLDAYMGRVLLALLPSFHAFEWFAFAWLGALPGYSGASVVYKNLFESGAGNA